MIAPLATLLLTVKEAAEEVRLSEKFMKREIRAGRLVARKYGRAVRIERCELEAWIKRGRKIEGTTLDPEECLSWGSWGYPPEKTSVTT